MNRFWVFLPLFVFSWLSAQTPDTEARSKDWTIEAQSLVVTPDGKQFAEGNVKIEQPGVFLLTADSVLYDEELSSVLAKGNVKIDYRTSLGIIGISAREMEYFLVEKRGRLEDVAAQFGDEFYFVGEQLDIVGKGDIFLIEKGILTACNQASPQWELEIRRARIEKEGYALIRGAQFRLKGFPLIYLPFLIVPAMQERRSGLLLPETGRSERNGSFYSQPFYWAPRRDLDFTLTPAIYKEAGLKFDLEARYRPRLDFSGFLSGSLFRDEVIETAALNGNIPFEDGKPLKTNRFRFNWRHGQSLLKGYLAVDVEAGSDFSVDRDYLQETAGTRIRDYYYRGRYLRDFGESSLSLGVARLERIFSQDDEVMRLDRLPELKFYQPTHHVGRGFFLKNFIYATQFDFEDLGPSGLRDQVLRMGLESEWSKTQNFGSLVQTRWGLGYKGAYFRGSDQLANKTIGGLFGFFEAVGPRLQRSYQRRNLRLIHYLDASLILQFNGDAEDPFAESVLFDELDIRIVERRKGLQTGWKLNSRFFAGRAETVRPTVELELRQEVDFNSDERPNLPIEMRFRVLNLRGFHANGIFEYNPDRGTLDTLSVYGSVNRGQWKGYGGYVKRRENDFQDRESFIGISQWDLRGWRSRFKVAMDYDFDRQEFKSQEFLYGYQGQCVGINVNYVKSPFDSSRQGNKDFIQLTLSLRNLGDLGTKF